MELPNEAVVKKSGEKLILSDCELEFISYPSEMHLWEGLLSMEKLHGIFFSSDLVFSLGKADGVVKEGNWQTEIGNISLRQIPDPEGKAKIQQMLAKLNPNFVAVGHGPCLRLAR